MASIPFDSGSGGVGAGSGTAIGVALLLLAVAYAVLWYARKRGWMGPPRAAGLPAGEGIVVEQRLRLGAASMAYVLRDGQRRLLVVESRQGVQVTALGVTEQAP